MEDKDACLVDPAMVMSMGKIQNFEEGNSSPLKMYNFEFEKDTSLISAIIDLDREDVIVIKKNKEEWAKISREYYNQACKVATAWNGLNKPIFYLQKEKNNPVLLAFNDLGFIIAPRIESDD